MALFRSLSIPSRRLLPVLRNAQTSLVTASKIALRDRITSVGSLAIKFNSFLVVFHSMSSFVICKSDIRLLVAIFSRSVIAFHRFLCIFRNATAFFMPSAVLKSASTSAAAPSETSEQSVRRSGPATIGFLSETVRQNS